METVSEKTDCFDDRAGGVNRSEPCGLDLVQVVDIFQQQQVEQVVKSPQRAPRRDLAVSKTIQNILSKFEARPAAEQGGCVE